MFHFSFTIIEWLIACDLDFWQLKLLSFSLWKLSSSSELSVHYTREQKKRGTRAEPRENPRSAYGEVCFKYKKRNQLAKVCQCSPKRTVKKTKPLERKTRQTRKLVHHVDKGNATDDLSSIYTLHSPEDNKQYNVAVCLTAKKSEAAKLAKFQTDTGASCSILTLQDYKKITDEKAPQPTNTPLMRYDRSVINPISSNTLRILV